MAAILSIAQASAAEPSTDERARLPALLSAGAAAAKAKDWNGCINALTAALAIEDSARVAGDLAMCEEGAGRFADAHEHLRRALSGAKDAMLNTEPWRTYSALRRRLSPKIALVMLQVHPPDARVSIDGRPAIPGSGRTFSLSPGAHTFLVRADGYKDAIETHTFKPGDLPNVDIHLDKQKVPPAPPIAPPAPERVPVPPPPVLPRPVTSEPSRSPFFCMPARSVRGVLVPPACVATVAFVANAAAAIGLQVHAESLRSALDARGFTMNSCLPGQPSAGSADCEEIQSRFRARNAASNVLIWTATVAGLYWTGAGLGIALMKPKRPTIAATASATGGGVIVRGTW